VKTFVVLTRRPDADAGQLARHSRPELLAVWKGMAEGAVRAVHGLQEGAGAVLEMETGTAAEAGRFVAALPYVQEGLLDVQVFALKPFPAFETLSSAAAA